MLSQLSNRQTSRIKNYHNLFARISSLRTPTTTTTYSANMVLFDEDPVTVHLPSPLSPNLPNSNQLTRQSPAHPTNNLQFPHLIRPLLPLTHKQLNLHPPQRPLPPPPKRLSIPLNPLPPRSPQIPRARSRLNISRPGRPRLGHSSSGHRKVPRRKSGLGAGNRGRAIGG